MEINGPIKLCVVEPTPQGNYDMHIDFKDDFKAPGQAAQGETIRAYLAEIGAAQAGGLEERDAQGVMLIQQICEQLQPHVEAGDIPLTETLVIEVQRTPGVNLTDLLR
mgnify:CR=1 FL=1